MIKRILPFLLILALIAVQLPYFLAVPVKAAEDLDDNNNTSINILDYATPNDSGSYTTSFTGSTRINFNLGVEYLYSYVDIVISVTGYSTFTSAKFSYDQTGFYDYGLNIIKLGVEGDATLYRLYGSTGTRWKTGFDLVLNTGSTSTTWVGFISFYANIAPASVFETSADVQLGTPAGDYAFSYTPGSINARKNISYSGTYLDNTFVMFVDFPDWKKYDYIDVQLYLHVDSITSIGAYCGERAIPLSVSYLNNSNTVGPNYYITVRLDLRGLDRSSSEPNILLTGQMMVSDASFVNTFSVLACNGYVIMSYGSLFTYWMNEAIQNSKKNNTSILAGIADAADQISAAISSGLGGNGQGAVIKDQGSQIGSDMSAAQAQLNAVDKPSGSNITAIDSLGSVGFAANTSYLTQIVNTKYIKDVFVFVAIMAILSLVLFGTKKGG